MSTPTAAAASTGTARARVRVPGGLLAAELVALAALVVRDPHRHGTWGSCPFLALTGLPCPWCGGLRATNDLAHGRVVDALSSNAPTALLVVGGLVGLAWWTAVAWRAARADRPDPVAARLDTLPVGRLVTAAMVLWCAFGVLRWWPPLAFLQP